MIQSKQAITMAEAKDIVDKLEDKDELKKHMKKFTKIKKDKAGKLAEEVRALNNPKIKEDDIIKLVDFLPQDAEDVNKIFTDMALNEEEINAILQITGKY